MEQDPNENNEKQQREDNTPQLIPSPLTQNESDGRSIHDAENEHQPSKDQQQQPSPSRFKRILRFFSSSEWLIVILTAVIAGTGIVGIFLVIQGDQDTVRIRDAAEKQACAAKSFAASADKINTGIGNAVIKLGKQADDNEIFFRTDERAWVEIGKIEIVASYPPESTFGKIFKYGIYPKNDGKTVARDVRIHIDNIENTSGSFGNNKHGISMFQDQLFHEMGSHKRVVIPYKPGPQTLAPGELSPVAVYSGGQEPIKWGTNYTYSFILGRIDYIDTFDVKHWKHFCFIITNAIGDLAHCQYGNDEDRNQETILFSRPN